MIKAIAFDLYGTLIDIRTDENDKRFRKKVSKLFKDIGGQGDFWQRYKSLCQELYKGEEYEFDLSEVFQTLLVGTDPYPTTFARYFRISSRKRFGVYHGVPQLLKTLRSRGIKVYLLSNAQACFTLDELSESGLDQLLDGIMISSQIGYCKPSPLLFEALLDRYNLDKSTTLYVGNDIKADVLGSKGAGLSSAYVRTRISPSSDTVKEAKRHTPNAFYTHRALIRYLLKITQNA